MVYSSYILHNCKENQTSPGYILQKTGAMCHHRKHTHTHNIGVISLYYALENKRGNQCIFFIFFLQNITQSMVPNIEKFAIQQTVLEQTAVIVKYKSIKCKQSVEGSIISQILKLPYPNGDVNEMEIIQ